MYISSNRSFRNIAQFRNFINVDVSCGVVSFHITQNFMSEYVDITEIDDGSYETEVDFETISALTNLLEDDDDPEVSWTI